MIMLMGSNRLITPSVKQRSLNNDVLTDVNANLYINNDRMTSIGRTQYVLKDMNANRFIGKDRKAGEINNVIAQTNTKEQSRHETSLNNKVNAMFGENSEEVVDANTGINLHSLSHTHEEDKKNSELQSNQEPRESKNGEISPLDYSIAGKKILVAIPSYGQKQFLFLQDMIDSFRDLCETGAQVTMIIYTTEPYSVEQLHLLNSRTNKCYHPNGNLHIHVKIKPPSLKLHFVDLHRKDFYDSIDQYDLFIYSEDDHHIRPTHVIGYLYETAKLRRLVGPVAFPNYSIGFLRYERDRDRAERHTFDQYEYKNAGLHSFANPALHDKYIGNRHMPHQGMFMATPEQLSAWKDRCNFHEIDPDQIEKGRGNPSGMSANSENNGDPDTPIWHREYVSSLRLFANEGIPIGNCQVTQLFPSGGHFENFMVHHMPDKYYENPNFEKEKNFNSLELQQYRLRIFNRENHLDTMTNDVNKGAYTGVTMELSKDDAGTLRSENGDMLQNIIHRMDEYVAYVNAGGVFLPKENDRLT